MKKTLVNFFLGHEVVLIVVQELGKKRNVQFKTINLNWLEIYIKKQKKKCVEDWAIAI